MQMHQWWAFPTAFMQKDPICKVSVWCSSLSSAIIQTQDHGLVRRISHLTIWKNAQLVQLCSMWFPLQSYVHGSILTQPEVQHCWAVIFICICPHKNNFKNHSRQGYSKYERPPRIDGFKNWLWVLWNLQLLLQCEITLTHERPTSFCSISKKY